MKEKFLIVAIGRDRVGLLATISTKIAELGGNIVDVRGESIRMDRLRIALISLVVEPTEEAPKDFGEKLRDMMQKIAEELELKVSVVTPSELE